MRTSRTATRRSGSSSAVRSCRARRARCSTRRCIADPNPANAGHDLPGLEQRLAHPGLGRQPGVPRGELPRVHRPRPRTRRAVTSSASVRRASDEPDRIERDRLPRHDPLRRQRRGDRAWRATRARCGRRRRPDASSSRRTRTRRPGSVTYTRLDSLAANSPGRFVSGIYVDPANSNHAWITYSSYSAITPATPGHVFSVTFNPAGRDRDVDEPRRLRAERVPGLPGDGRRGRLERRPLRGGRLGRHEAAERLVQRGRSQERACRRSRSRASRSCPARASSTPPRTAGAPGSSRFRREAHHVRGKGRLRAALFIRASRSCRAGGASSSTRPRRHRPRR